MKVKLLDGTEVEFKPLFVKDMREADKIKDDIDKTAFLIKKSTGLELEVDEIDVRDFGALQEGVLNFLPKSAVVPPAKI